MKAIDLSKFIFRSKLITLEGINGFLRPITSVALSALVIRYLSPEFWGQFVPLIIGMELAFNIVNWGNRHYLIATFSKSPHQISQLTSDSIVARLPLLLLACLMVPFFFNADQTLYILIWGVGRYIHHSFDAIVQYNRDYVMAIVIETLGAFILIGGVLYYKDELTISLLISYYAYCFSVKAIIFLIKYYPELKTLKSVSLKSSKQYLFHSAPFFFLAVTGLLQTKTDLYVASFYMRHSEIASYQVLVAFLGVTQGFSALILNPFTKNIMRLGDQSLKKLKRIYLMGGLVLSACAILGTFLVMKFVYNITFDLEVYLLGYLYVTILYTYMVESLELMKKNKSSIISLNCILASGFNLILSIGLIPILGISGALIAGIVSRFFLAYVIKSKNNQLKTALQK